MEYFALLIPVSILSHFYRSKYSLGFLFLAVTAISLFAAGRNEVGNDWQEYEKYYDKIIECSDIGCALLATRLEPGFVLAAFSLSTYLGSYKEFLFIVSIFSIFGFFKSFSTYGTPLLLVLIGYLRFEYLQTNFMFVRQGIALVFFIYSIRFIREEKIKNFFISIFIGSFFHILSFALLPIYFLARKSSGFRVHYFILMSSIILMLLNVDLLRSIVSIFPVESIRFVILSYLDSDAWGGSAGFSISLLEKIIVLFIGVAMRRQLSLDHEYYDIFLKLHFICVAIWFFTFNSYVFNERLSVFLNIGQIYLLALFVKSIKNNYIKFAAITLMLLWCHTYLFKALFLSVGSEVYHPYSNFIFAI